jgi:hypothetical protein
MNTLLLQDPTKPRTALYRRVRSLLLNPRLETFRVVVAYARWSGVASVANAMEAFLRRGGCVETIYGVDNGVTTPDALLYSEYLQRSYSNYRFAGVTELRYSDSIFHPKFFEFGLDDHVIALVGSANFTEGGLFRNSELVVELNFSSRDAGRPSLRQLWSGYKRQAHAITPDRIRRLVDSQRLSSEGAPAEGEMGGVQVKRLGTRIPGRRARPLFLRILKSKVPAVVKHGVLADADGLSDKPQRLYLQILRETGGGHQVQLPVATLGSFFSVGKGQSKKAIFNFDEQSIRVHLTHFENNTHRIRLRPLQQIKRPAILVFTRSNQESYECEIVPSKDYAKTLTAKCVEQTRRGSRRWGLEG